MTEEECLKLFLNFFVRQMLGRAEVATAGVVDYDVEIASDGQRALEAISQSSASRSGQGGPGGSEPVIFLLKSAGPRR